MISGFDNGDWIIEMNDREVVHMFDDEGDETFDPTQAFEVNLVDSLVRVEVGDKFTFEKVG